MEHFYLIANPSKKGTDETAKQIMEYLREKGASCEGSTQKKRKRGDGYTSGAEIPKKTQCVITLGGDGTLIQAARDLVDCQLPLVGINMGTLGYLTQISGGEEISPMLDALLEDRYGLERRMMLDGRIVGIDGEERDRGISLNDIVLTRKDVMQVLRIQVYVNGDLLNQYTADGMIVSTPTGSTAYNLSAGGPIVAPGAELMVITPICSHSLNARSIVLSAKDHVRLEVALGSAQKQMAVFDGDRVIDLSRGEVLEIRQSKSYANLITLKDVSFLDNLRNKMTPV